MWSIPTFACPIGNPRLFSSWRTDTRAKHTFGCKGHCRTGPMVTWSPTGTSFWKPTTHWIHHCDFSLCSSHNSTTKNCKNQVIDPWLSRQRNWTGCGTLARERLWKLCFRLFKTASNKFSMVRGIDWGLHSSCATSPNHHTYIGTHRNK